MAISLRRVLSARNLALLRTSFRSSDLSYTCSSNSNPCNFVSETSLFGTNRECSNRLGFDFLRESRRGFAKGRKSKDSDGGNTVEVVPDIGPSVKATAVSQMEAATVALSRELSKLRTGRASAGMLDHIIVETSGVKMPLSRVAVVSVIDSQTLSVTPYDPDAIKELEKAIVSSPLGINPQVDGQRLIAAIPPLTKEHMQAMCKVVAKSSEDVKQSIRRARQKALDMIKKASSNIPKDDAKRLEKEVDELTKKFVKSAEDMCKAKEKEITSG
ncbi:Ribosome recycling factor [Macleaya cordata]|uniref:Ribosome-recycling factor, chloroplastic n=1 Tax=Macleaya cordata TaxID=56857 RepID=A0A200QY71_MACCD|nr:Ribosome recycling factor [Macleaya cordata]